MIFQTQWNEQIKNILFALSVNLLIPQAGIGETPPAANKPAKSKPATKFVNYGPSCLSPYQLEYSTKIFGMNVTSKSTLEKQGQHFVSRMSAESLFSSIEETSRFNYSRNRVQPLEYQYQRSGMGSGKDINIDFKWSEKKAIYRYNKKTYQSDIRNFKIYQDKVSYQHQLCLELSQDINKKEIKFYVPYKNRLKVTRWQNEGLVSLKTELGILPAIKLSRIRDDEDRSTTIWLARDHQFLLLKLEQEEDGESYNLEIKNAKLDGGEL